MTGLDKIFASGITEVLGNRIEIAFDCVFWSAWAGSWPEARLAS